jgi:hypothetical protein
MTQQRDIERILDAWFGDGPTVGSDRLIEAVIDRIERQPQRSFWQVRWGRSRRTVDVRLALVGLAAVLLATIVGLGVLGRLPSFVPPAPATPRPTVEGSPTPSPSPTIAPAVSLPIGPGRVVFEHMTPGRGSRLEYLAPDLRGAELLPDVPGIQEWPAWDPTGDRLAFAAFDPADPASHEAIFETDASAATPRQVTTDCTPPACLEETNPAYSADGRRMTLIRIIGPAGGPPTSTIVAIRDLATGRVMELETTRTRFADGFVEHPALSPDGRLVAYSRITVDASGNSIDSVVYVVGADGTEPRPLTAPGFEAGDPSWSPDGSRILFSREIVHHWFGEGKGTGSNTFIYTMASDGSDVKQLTTERTGAMSWITGGSQILYSLINDSGSIGTPDINVMNADASDQRSVARYGDCCRWYPVQQPTP